MADRTELYLKHIDEHLGRIAKSLDKVSREIDTLKFIIENFEIKEKWVEAKKAPDD